MKRLTLPKWLYLPLSLLFWIGIWWLIAALYAKPLLLPTPPAVIKTLFTMLGTALFWKTTALSLLRIFLGILAALAAGAVLAFFTVKSRLLHRLFAPLLSLFKATPVASVIFLILLLVGRVRVASVISFMMALPIVWSNMAEGLSSTDKKLLEMAEVFALPFRRRLLAIHIPSIMPYFAAACRSAISIAWKAGIAAEVLCSPNFSIGGAIFESKQYLLTDELFAWTLTVVLISVLLERATLALLRLFSAKKWQGGESV